MPIYYVKTNADYFPRSPSLARSASVESSAQSRTIVIEADRFLKDPDSGDYSFYKNAVLVASINPREVLAVLEEDAYQADYFFAPETEEMDEDDGPCLHCQFLEFLKDPEFFDEVYNIVDFYHSPDNEKNPAPDETPAVAPAEQYPIEHWRDKDGSEWWGFQTDKGFVYFGGRDSAESGRHTQISDPDTWWSYKDLTGATRLED